jgi:glutathione synthase/RimK-type ligase-like ATP-grasp enzyme
MKDFNFDLILFTSGPKAYAPKRIAKECATKNKKFIIIKYKDVNISFKKNDFELNYLGGKMPTSRAIFLRGLGEDPVYSPLKLAITNWYKKNGSKVVNFESYNTWPTLDKITQHINLSKNGLPIVESFTFGSKENLIKWSKDNHPFIAKDVTGSCGCA